MSVDPVDDCTFWYTNEYLKSSGTFNWSTWIASFKFSTCGSTTPVHDVAVASITAPSPVVVNTAQTVSATVKNLGTQAESFTVSLSDSLASSITSTPQNVNLGAGASQIVTFAWTPSVTGTHTLTATAATVNGETNTANNTSQTTSTVNPVSGRAAHHYQYQSDNPEDRGNKHFLHDHRHQFRRRGNRKFSKWHRTRTYCVGRNGKCVRHYHRCHRNGTYGRASPQPRMGC